MAVPTSQLKTVVLSTPIRDATSLSLQEAEVEAFADVIPDRMKIRRVRPINEFRRSEHEITKWQRTGARADSNWKIQKAYSRTR